MKKNDTTTSYRKSAPLAAAAMGAAMCLSGGSAYAITGSVSASNGGDTSFTVPRANINLFGSLAQFNLVQILSNYMSGVGGALQVAINGGPILHVGVGVNVSTTGTFANLGTVVANQSTSYIPCRFVSGGTKYGWVHCVSTNAGANQMVLDTWAYDPTGGAILTLGESLDLKALPLADGRMSLRWNNANEEGVARYEVQAKGADGGWSAVDSDTPGAGSYAATVARGGEYRLAVESSNGAVRTLGF